MPKREISKIEMEQLHAFCLQHHVKFYDIRLELTDHLASNIEALWIDYPNMTFENALEKVYANYGPTGFRKIIADREKGEEKVKTKNFIKVVKSLFHWPQILKILPVFLSFIFFFNFYKQGKGKVAAIFIMCMGISILSFEIAYLIHAYKMRKKLKEPLISTQYHGLSTLSTIAIFSGYFSSSFFFEKSFYLELAKNPSLYFLCSFLLMGIYIILLAEFKHLSNSYTKAKESYPLAFKN